jgi:putative ABC transport system permease protein
MPLADYRALTGDMDVSDAALWLAKAPRASAAAALKPCPSAPAGSVEPSDIRAMSLQIFDRSFAVTYLLEAIAIVIGLFGVAATFSAQTLARARNSACCATWA